LTTVRKPARSRALSSESSHGMSLHGNLNFTDASSNSYCVSQNGKEGVCYRQQLGAKNSKKRAQQYDAQNQKTVISPAPPQAQRLPCHECSLSIIGTPFFPNAMSFERKLGHPRRWRRWRDDIQSQLPSGRHQVLPLFRPNPPAVGLEKFVHARHHGGSNLVEIAASTLDELLHVLREYYCVSILTER